MSSHRREHLADHRDRRGTDQHHEDAGKDEDHQGKDQFHCGLGSLFLGQLTAAGTHRVALHAQRLGHARTKLIGLDQDRRQAAQVFVAGARAQLVEHFARERPI